MSIRFLCSLFAVAAITHTGCSQSSAPPEKTIATAAVIDDALSKIDLSSGAAESAKEFRRPEDVISEGRFTVDILELVAPARLNELALRFQQAAQENQEWFLEHVQKAAPGQPLPYDARFGLTESEYAEFLELSKVMTMQKTSEATLKIASIGDGAYQLDGGRKLADFTGIVIDLKNDRVQTPFGDLTEKSVVNSTEKSAIGLWTGVQWKLDAFDEEKMDGVIAKFSVGKLNETGRCVIYYDVRAIGSDGQARITHVLNFDRRPTK